MYEWCLPDFIPREYFSWLLNVCQLDACASHQCYKQITSFTDSLGAFRLAASVLGFRAGESECESPLRTLSAFTLALCFSWMQAMLAFKTRCFGVLSLRWRSSKLGCSVCSSQLLLLRQKVGFGVSS